jgi:hypothetical protein
MIYIYIVIERDDECKHTRPPVSWAKRAAEYINKQGAKYHAQNEQYRKLIKHNIPAEIVVCYRKTILIRKAGDHSILIGEILRSTNGMLDHTFVY